MPTLADTFTWAAYETPLKAALEITGTAEDSTLQNQLALAAKWGDNRIGCRWLTGTTIPAADVGILWEGVLAFIKKLRAGDAADGATSIRQGDFSIAYKEPETILKAALRAANKHWCVFKTGASIFR